MLLCVAMLFCSCGEEERAVLGYEQPVATLITAAQYSDTQSYLSCFTPEAEAEYKNSDSYNEALAETLLTRGEEKTELSYKLSSKKELDSDGLKDLEKSYKESYHKNVTIKKAVTMTAKLTETTDSGLGGHVGADVRDARVARMLFVGNEQVKLGVFLNLNTQLIQALDGGIAGEEVLRARAEGDDFQITHAQNGTGNRHKLGDLVGNFLRRADGILGNIALQMAHAEIVGAVQHTAVRISAAIDHIAVALGCRYEHAGAVKVLGNQRFGRFGAEVAEEYGQRIAV